MSFEAVKNIGAVSRRSSSALLLKPLNCFPIPNPCMGILRLGRVAKKMSPVLLSSKDDEAVISDVRLLAK